MVWGLISNIRQGLKYRGGWRGLVEHMYTNGDFPFKFGTYMGGDMAGNRYYENKVDYPFGQHRWVEPGNIHNFDSSQVPPEWHGWLTSMNDSTPYYEHEYIAEMEKRQIKSDISHAPYTNNLGHQEPVKNFNHMHDQSQIRPRGYGIGNAIVGLPPGAASSYYTQPGSLYNEASIRKLEYIGDLDEATGGGRPYKSALWKERLKTDEDRAEEKRIEQEKLDEAMKKIQSRSRKLTKKEEAILARGGTIPGY